MKSSASSLSLLSYEAALQSIFRLEPNPKLGLARVLALLKHISLQKDSTHYIQVAGTNGKGSVCAFLEAIFMHHGKKVGVFTSPHLSSVRERMRINQQDIPKEVFTSLANKVLGYASLLTDTPSFFEVLLAIALEHFLLEKVDVIVLETGLGGRLDATTAVKSHLLGITTIAKDHMHILGATLEEIAYEKIHAANRGQKVVSVSQSQEVAHTFKREQEKLGFQLEFAQKSFLPSCLKGEHQKENLGLALKLTQESGLTLDDCALSKALQNVKHFARLEEVNFLDRKIIIDGAHNPNAFEALFAHLKKEVFGDFSKWQLIFSGVNGHETVAMAKIVKTHSKKLTGIFVKQLKNPRGLSIPQLKEVFSMADFSPYEIKELTNLKEIIESTPKDTVTIVAGSLYLAGEIRSSILSLTTDNLVTTY